MSQQDEHRLPAVEKIISGGQTGADRAALDCAIAHGISHGGWCPQGRLAEDGVIHPRYQLTETPSVDPAQRTEWNVRDSDGTVIFSINRRLAGGSRLTARFARQYNKPWLHLSRQGDRSHAVRKLTNFLTENRVKVLNVAGPRHSGEPQVSEFTQEILNAVLAGSLL